MKILINKERTWIFSPVSNIVIKIALNGPMSVTQLKKAIGMAVSQNEVLKSKVILEDGKTYFTEMENANYSITETTRDWTEIKKEQEKIPFDLENGELIRFFILSNESTEGQTIALLMIAHHITGDGTSYAYLAEDILRALNREKLVYKKVNLMTLEDFPKKSKLNFLMRFLLSKLNKKWRKTGKQFSFEEFKRMNETYWKGHSTYTTTYQIEEETYKNLLMHAKEQNVTINSILTTAFFKAAKDLGEAKKQSVGEAVSIREDGNRSMGNFASGISIDYCYNEKKDFYENTRIVQKALYKKVSSDRKKYFLEQFMGHIDGSLNDAVYFAAVEGYDNKTAKTFANLFNYDGNPKGISITNLTKLPIENKIGSYELSEFTLCAPLVLNAKRIIGIASLESKMALSYSVEDNEERENSVRFFKSALEILENLAK